MFEIIYENINDIDHNNDIWAKRDSQMKLETDETEKPRITLKETKKTKKKTKIIKKIEKEYEIVNDQKINNQTENKIIENMLITPTVNLDQEPLIPIKKTRKPKKIN